VATSGLAYNAALVTMFDFHAQAGEDALAMREAPRLGCWVLGLYLLSFACQRPAARVPVKTPKCSEHALEWVRQFSSSAQVSVTAIAASSDGGVIAIGEFKQSLRIAGGAQKTIDMAARGDTDAFVIKIQEDGKIAWQRTVGGLKSSVSLAGLFVRTDGSVLVGGQYTGAPLMDSSPGQPEFALPSCEGSGSEGPRRLLAVLYSPDGVPRHSITSVDVGKERSLAALASAGNDVVISGTFSGQLQLGNAPHPVKLESRGQTDVFLARLTENGDVRWVKRIGGQGQDTAGPLTTTRSGSLLIAGTFSDSGDEHSPLAETGATIGDNHSLVMRSHGRRDAFIARFDADGQLAFAQSIGGPSNEPAEADRIAALLATDDDGTLVLANASLPAKVGQGGHFLESADLEFGSFLAKFSANGELGWELPLGAPTMSGMAKVPGGDLLILGKASERIFYPVTGNKRQTLTPEGLDDVLLARHGQNGELRWLTRFGGKGSDLSGAITSDRTGIVTFTAAFRDAFLIDACPPVTVSSQGRTSVLLARVAPGAVLSDQPREMQIAKTEARVRVLRAAANKALLDKQLEQACSKFQEIVDLVPRDPGARLDHASCLSNLGRKDDAISENHQVIAMGSRNVDVDSESAEKLRRQAYLNLYALGHSVELPKDGCRALVGEPHCRQQLWACAGQSKTSGAHGEVVRSLARIGVSLEGVRVETDEELDPVMPSLDHWGFSDSSTWPSSHNWLARAEAVDVLIHEQSSFVCAESSGPDCKSDQSSIDCTVVMANACSGLVGVVCAEPDSEQGDRKIDEFYLWRGVVTR